MSTSSSTSLDKKNSYCYWSVGDNEYRYLLENLVKSVRSVGITEDFHIWSDKDVGGSISHRIDSNDIGRLNANSLFPYEFKFKYLRRMLDFEYDYYIYLDSDMYFVRRPNDPLALLKGDPIHLFLETNINTKMNPGRSEWWGCPLPEIALAMRECGVKSKNIYNLNGGFFIIDRQYVSKVLSLGYRFWQYMKDKGYPFIADEIPLSYAMHMLCRSPEDHLLRDHLDYIGTCDYKDRGVFKKILSGGSWISKWRFSKEDILVNPAIVHCLSFKEQIIEMHLGFPRNIWFKVYQAKRSIMKFVLSCFRAFDKEFG